MAHIPTFKILVYRTLQNVIQPPSAGKNHFPTSGTVLCSPTSAVETKCPARRNKSQVSAKVMIVLPVMGSSKSENKTADELHTGNTLLSR